MNFINKTRMCLLVVLLLVVYSYKQLHANFYASGAADYSIIHRSVEIRPMFKKTKALSRYQSIIYDYKLFSFGGSVGYSIKGFTGPHITYKYHFINTHSISCDLVFYPKGFLIGAGGGYFNFNNSAYRSFPFLSMRAGYNLFVNEAVISIESVFWLNPATGREFIFSPIVFTIYYYKL